MQELDKEINRQMFGNSREDRINRMCGVRKHADCRQFVEKGKKGFFTFFSFHC